VPLQALPGVAEAYGSAQRAVVKRALASTAALWRSVGPEFDASYGLIETDLLSAVATAQLELVRGAQDYVPDVLTDMGARAAAVPVAVTDPTPLVGRAGDGRPLESLFRSAVTGAKQLVSASGPALEVPEALRRSGLWLMTAVATALSDSARQSESLAMGVRPKVTTYVRMLNPPSCSRCVILAGARYRASVPFRRHPRCDCRHVPATEAGAGDDMTVNPAEYFDSLAPDEQERVFGTAGAEAIRAGADMGQVVNARRGMHTAQVGGRRVLVTSEGTTRRGIAYRYLSDRTSVRITPERPERRAAERRVARPRLMPETIRAVAVSQDDYVRLLRANGYLRS